MAYQPKPYRKFLATTATAALVATAVSPVYAASFTDVSGNYKEAVDYLVNNKITDGTSTAKFGTDLTVKRVDAAVMLAKALKLKVEGVKDSGFTDVPTRAKAYVDALKAAGIVNGKTTKTFGSDQNITRGEMAIMLAKAYKITGNKAKLSFTDVAPRYQDAVAALVDHKITSGKTAKSFGTEQAIKRGEFAVFLYKLSKIEKEDPIVTTTVNVSNEADLLAALKNDKITKIVLEANITSPALPVISRNVEIDLNGKTLTGNLQYNLPNETESITLSSSKAGAYVQGSLSVNTPKADFIVGENVEILGTTTVVNVKASTFYNKGILNSVTVEDSDGTSFANKDHGMIRSKLAIEAVGTVRLIGKIDSVVVNKPAGITVENEADINDMLVTVNGVTVNAPSGTVETLRTPSGVTVKNPEGQPVETKPENPSTGGGSGGGGAAPVVKQNVTFTGIDGATIVVKNSNSQVITPETDGSYKLVKGTYSYTVTKAGFKTKTGTLTVNGSAVTEAITLEVDLIKQNVTFTGVDGATVEVKDSNDQVVAAELDGSYKLVDGTYSYTVTKVGFKTKTGTLTVNGSAVTEAITLEVDLNKQNVTFTGVEGATVEVKDSNDQVVAAELDGSYKLVDGTYSYTIKKLGFKTQVDTFTVNGSTLQKDITLEAKTITYAVDSAASANGITLTFSESVGVNGGVNLAGTGGTVADAEAMISGDGEKTGKILTITSTNGAADGETVVVPLIIDGMDAKVKLTWNAGAWSLTENPANLFQDVTTPQQN